MEPTGNPPQEGGSRKSRLNSSIVAAGVAFGITLAGLGVASAQSDAGDATATTAAPEASAGAETTPSTEAPAASTPSTTAKPDPSTGRAGRPGRAAETELTGETADKVRAAALAAVPGGTIIRVETDNDGSPYEAHVRKADGTEVVVKVNEAFEVTAVEEGHMGHMGRKGPGGPGRTPLAADVAAEVEAAALAAVPNGTIIRVQGDADGGYHAHVRNAEGTELVVRMDADFQVTATEESTGRPGGPGGRHHRGPAPDDRDAESETD